MIWKAIMIVAIILILIPFKLLDGDNAVKGVEICGNKYNCGASDGICPESYVGDGKCFVRDVDC